MARNASGVHSLPNSIASGDAVSASPVQANFSDLSAEITASLPRDGSVGMSAPLQHASGSAAAPAATFSADTNTGFYRVGADDLGVAAGGVKVGGYDADGPYDKAGLTIVGLPTGLGPLPWSADTAPAGWVRCNGRTIGSATSGASERANADCEALFLHLWQHVATGVLSVASGAGASAAADWAANKTLTLFDTRDRAVAGTGDMGNSAAGRLGTVHTTSTTIGSAAGTETHTLTEAQLPAHTHDKGTLTVTTTGTSTVATVQRGNTQTVVDIGISNAVPLFNQGSITVNSTGTVNGGATGSIGSGTAHSNLQPTIVFPMIIKL